MGHTPLHLAAGLGCDDMMPLILQQGAVVDALDNQRRTPLHLAATVGSCPAVEVLLAAGADLSLRSGDNNESALETAAINGDVDVVRAMVRHGVDVNARDSQGLTALHAVAESNQAGAIDALVEAGAHVNARGRGWKGGCIGPAEEWCGRSRAGQLSPHCPPYCGQKRTHYRCQCPSGRWREASSPHK
ncbi:unnamed protein product [Ectocarpus sp. CCAP 1310/34]|nr:unnamed protein product [Ectocarpus sp. CCAP 1310/34]